MTLTISEAEASLNPREALQKNSTDARSNPQAEFKPIQQLADWVNVKELGVTS